MVWSFWSEYLSDRRHRCTIQLTYDFSCFESLTGRERLQQHGKTKGRKTTAGKPGAHEKTYWNLGRQMEQNAEND